MTPPEMQAAVQTLAGDGHRCHRCGATASTPPSPLTKCAAQGCPTHMHDRCSGMAAEAAAGLRPTRWYCPTHTHLYTGTGESHTTVCTDVCYEYCQRCGGRSEEKRPLYKCDEPGCLEAFHAGCATKGNHTYRTAARAYCTRHLSAHGEAMLRSLCPPSSQPTHPQPNMVEEVTAFVEQYGPNTKNLAGCRMPQACPHPNVHRALVELGRDATRSAPSNPTARKSAIQLLSGLGYESLALLEAALDAHYGMPTQAAPRPHAPEGPRGQPQAPPVHEPQAPSRPPPTPPNPPPPPCPLPHLSEVRAATWNTMGLSCTQDQLPSLVLDTAPHVLFLTETKMGKQLSGSLRSCLRNALGGYARFISNSTGEIRHAGVMTCISQVIASTGGATAVGTPPERRATSATPRWHCPGAVAHTWWACTSPSRTPSRVP
jgi:hypothetical protein